MNIAIIGSREFTNYNFLESVLKELKTNYKITSIISGGARGADALAKRYAKEKNITYTEHKPDWSKGKFAGVIRNTLIINDADIVIALRINNSKGTTDSVHKAIKQNKIVWLYDVVLDSNNQKELKFKKSVFGEKKSEFLMNF